MTGLSSAKAGFSFVVIASILFGTTGTAQQLAGLEISGLYIGAARQIVGGIALVLLVLAFGEKRLWSVVKSKSGLLAAVGTFIYQITFFIGISNNGVSIGTVIALGSAPVFTALLSKLMLKEQIRSYQVFIFLLVSFGIYLLLVGFDGGIELSWGILASLGAGLGYALYTVNAKALVTAGVDSTTALAAAFGGAVPIAAVVLLLGDWQWLGGITGIALALYLGIFPTALAYFFFGKGLKVLSAATVATITLIEPVVATLFAVILVGEKLVGHEVFGIGVVLAGLLVLGQIESRNSNRATR
jgi:DME family drug/metabolite transporter